MSRTPARYLFKMGKEAANSNPNKKTWDEIVSDERFKAIVNKMKLHKHDIEIMKMGFDGAEPTPGTPSPESIFFFGKYRGQKYKDVPTDYLKWVWRDADRTKYGDVIRYIRYYHPFIMKEDQDKKDETNEMIGDMLNEIEKE